MIFRFLFFISLIGLVNYDSITPLRYGSTITLNCKNDTNCNMGESIRWYREKRIKTDCSRIVSHGMILKDTQYRVIIGPCTYDLILNVRPVDVGRTYVCSKRHREHIYEDSVTY